MAVQDTMSSEIDENERWVVHPTEAEVRRAKRIEEARHKRLREMLRILSSGKSIRFSLPARFLE